MSVHEKMSSDYLWVRNAPVEEGLKQRNHGYWFIYDRAPNHVERLEMTYRSIGKQYDWELEKFRLGRKGIDKANKKRGIKNLLRFIKNPHGYVFWRASKMFPTFPNLMVFSFGLYFFISILDMKAHSKAIDESDQLLLQLGKNVEGSQGRMKGFHNRTHIRSANVIDSLIKTPLSADQIVLNPTWKQNLRKELQLINANNVQI